MYDGPRHQRPRIRHAAARSADSSSARRPAAAPQHRDQQLRLSSAAASPSEQVDGAIMEDVVVTISRCAR